MASAGASPKEIRETLARRGAIDAVEETIQAIQHVKVQREKDHDFAESYVQGMMAELARASRDQMERQIAHIMRDVQDGQDDMNSQRSDGNDPYELDPDAVVKVNTGRAILCSVANGTHEIWVPISCVHRNTEVPLIPVAGVSGKLVVQKWFARRNGYYVKED